MQYLGWRPNLNFRYTRNNFLRISRSHAIFLFYVVTLTPGAPVSVEDVWA